MSRRTALVEGLADRYYARVLAFARQLTDASTAEDITQEVFARLMSVEQLEERTISVSYLLKAAHNLVRGQHRRQVRGQRCMDQLARRRAGTVSTLEPKALPASPDRTLERSFARLSERERDALRLTVCSDLSLKEASTALGVRITTLTNWKYRGLRKLGEYVRAG